MEASDTLLAVAAGFGWFCIGVVVVALVAMAVSSANRRP